MMQTKLFRPSAAPALENCVYFESGEAEAGSKKALATEEGDHYHKDFAALFSGKKQLYQIPKTRRKKAEWAIGVQRLHCRHPKRVESLIDVYGENEEWLTTGTIDLCGLDEYDGSPILSLIDWKPGEYIDRWAQVYIYGKAMMDAHNEPRCKVVLGFYGVGAIDWRIIEYEEARARLEALVERKRQQRGPEYHTINAFCAFCSLRLSPSGCPAWNEHLELVGQQTDWPFLVGQKLGAIKSAPDEVLAKYVIAKRRFEALHRAVDLDAEVVRRMQAQGVDHWHGLKFQSRGVALVVDQKFEDTKTDGGVQLERGENNKSETE